MTAILASCSKLLVTHDLENPDPVTSFTHHSGNINCCQWNHNSF